MRRRLVLVLAATILTTGCSAIQYSAWKTSEFGRTHFTHAGRSEKLMRSGVEALEDKRYDAALDTFERVSRRQPEDSWALFLRAQTLARMGRAEEAWTAFLDLARAGKISYLGHFDDDAALKPFKADPRWTELASLAEANGAAMRQKDYDARRPVDPATVPAAKSYKAIQEEIEALEREVAVARRRMFPPGSSYHEQLRRQQQAVARVVRYVADHPNAPDRERAKLGEVRYRAQVADWRQYFWRKDEGVGVAQAASEFLAEYPKSSFASEVRLLQAVGHMRAVLDPLRGWELDRADAYRYDCDEAVPILEELAERANEDPQGAQAQGLLALCAWQRDPRDETRARELAVAFLEREGDVADRRFMSLAAELRLIRLRTAPLPPFEGADLAGVRWSAESLPGRVSILQFWSPG